MSLTGYVVAIVLVGYRCSATMPKYRGRIAVAASIAVLMVFGSRPFVASLFPEGEVMRAIVGIRSQSLETVDDLSSGRVSTMVTAFDVGTTSVIGEGFPTVLGDGGREGLGSAAPLLWLAFGGLPGLLLVLVWQSQAIFGSQVGRPPSRRIFGALLCLETLAMIYGTCLSPGLGAATAGTLSGSTLDRSPKRVGSRRLAREHAPNREAAHRA